MVKQYADLVLRRLSDCLPSDEVNLAAICWKYHRCKTLVELGHGFDLVIGFNAVDGPSAGWGHARRCQADLLDVPRLGRRASFGVACPLDPNAVRDKRWSLW